MLATGLQLERMKTVTDDSMNASISVYLQNSPCTPRSSFSKGIIETLIQGDVEQHGLLANTCKF